MKRTETRSIQVRDITIGGQNKVVIQSMCNTRTSDIEATVTQILQLEQVGCELVRMAIIDEADAAAITEIRKRTHIPLVADIHYDYRLAIAAVKAGIDKIRLNPGNIGSKENVKAVVAVCKEYHIPIRIGINSGSLEKDIHEKYGRPTAEGMMESAQRHVQILEELDYHYICLSFKSSDPLLCIDAYRMASTAFPYPLHLGVTEAGPERMGLIKSAVGIGSLLQRGIGDTIRVSLTADPVKEIAAGKDILKALDLDSTGPQMISCPSCGRTKIDLIGIANEVEQRLRECDKPLKVAVMGCAVNGPGEAKEADIGIAGGDGVGLIFKKGEVIKKVPEDILIDTLMEEILKM